MTNSVDTGWRTATSVIVIIVGAALLTLVAFIYRRQKMLRQRQTAPQMQQRYGNSESFASDPEAHTPLLSPPDAVPPVPPKSGGFTLQLAPSSELVAHHRSVSSVGGLEDWGSRVRVSPSRVPVPPLFPEPPVTTNQRHSFHEESKRIHVLFPEPSSVPSSAPPSHTFLFPLSQIKFPRLQIKSGGKKGRPPSLRIEFDRESCQVTSPSPGGAFKVASSRHTPPPSAVSAPSIYSRPFATMSTTSVPQVPPLPLPAIPPVSPSSISKESPSIASRRDWTTDGSVPSYAVNSILDAHGGSSPSSVQTVGHGLFARRLSTEDASFQTVSRNSSTRPFSDPARPRRTLSISSRSSLANSSSGSASSGGAPRRRATTWVPNVTASYSPWHGVISQARDPQGQANDGEPVESPTNELRVAEAYRPMPTLTETPEVTPATLPSPLPRPIPPRSKARPAPSYLSADTASKAGQDPRSPSPSYMSEDPLPLPPQLAAMPRAQAARVQRLPSPHEDGAGSPPLPSSPQHPAES